MRILLNLAPLILALSACNPQPQPIDFGADACDFCRMTIVDQRYAAQLVTTKGRNYRFDAIECLLRFDQERTDPTPASHYLVANFDQPGLMLDATQAGYLISPQLPSPMGANLTAFDSRERATQAQQTHPGMVYNWLELKTQLASQTH